MNGFDDLPKLNPVRREAEGLKLELKTEITRVLAETAQPVTVEILQAALVDILSKCTEDLLRAKYGDRIK